MSLNRNGLRHVLGAFASLLIFAVMAAAQSSTAPQADFSNVKIKNFGQMDERFYRGAQPKEKDYESLKALGITTVVDLLAEPREYSKRAVEALGMRYVNIPMIGKKYPTEEAVQAFMKLVDDPETGKFYVHCAGGRHRTGAMGAVYRFTKYNWNFEQVYAEMKKYDFYTSWGHGDFKDFVEDFWARMQNANAQAAPASGR
ncbi:MAG TPA: tyrosine-protein phosphatase [Pyrinomonadaceae bacterium]|nr:tyrosine-protein phosphatase [Pyrinomonadaceae bacterium]